ncbi:hypothetical protein HK097_002370, partial [Rhizophlyctis rosea]
MADLPDAPHVPSAARIPVSASPSTSHTDLSTSPARHGLQIPGRKTETPPRPGESELLVGSFESEGSVENLHDSRLAPPRGPPPRRLSKVKSLKTVNYKNPTDILNAVNSVVKNRTGSVLARQTILKSDHFDTAVNTRLDFYLQGAPNFRSTPLNVFGVAQPTVSGISTILTLLNCHPTSTDPLSTIWFSSREEPIIYLNRKPFVLRDSEHPLTNIRTYSGISASRLERMED